MTTRNILTTFLAVFVFTLPNPVNAADHTVNAQAREYKPAILYIQPGDTVKFVNMTSHNSVSYIVPEGGKQFGEKGKLAGSSFSVKPEGEGIYGYVCEPHIGFGMVGVIVIGDVSADDVAATKKKAIDTLEGPFRRLIGKINKIKPTK
ncbi:MAG: plastocyanin/azurin family copper-binding protein [Proteobacteria bacterium]|nr:plastocyanin/azurin family copper-binding protein [Pseudomonadota bacterium]